jgi:bacterioferritin-associated ferredoxin
MNQVQSSARAVCHCLQVTEEMLLDALHTFDLRNLKEVRERTGAGDGCTACHRQLRAYLERHTSLNALQPSAST